MKLTIGDNIRTLRRANDMTQEQLADRLGVTYQSVSRWENGNAYPDIELLPAIAEIFGTSADKLLGMPEEEKIKRAKVLIENFCTATYETPDDTEKLSAMLREIRRDKIFNDSWMIWFRTNNAVLWSKELLPEFRLLAEEILALDPKDTGTVETMAAIEDDEHIEGLLEKYAYDTDLSRLNLLRVRYLRRNDMDKHEPLKQFVLLQHIEQIITNNFRDSRKPVELADSIAVNNFALNTLHGYCCETPDIAHPISANGEVDFFASERIALGLRKACYLASSGDTEGAFTVLDDVISLLEKVMKITSSVELRCSSPWASELKYTAEECWINPGNNPTSDQERAIDISIRVGNVAYCNLISPSDNLWKLTDSNAWAWFNPIRNDPRYQGYVDRVKALVQTRPAQSDDK